MHEFSYNKTFHIFMEDIDGWITIIRLQIGNSPSFLADTSKFSIPVSTRNIVEPNEPLTFVMSNYSHSFHDINFSVLCALFSKKVRRVNFKTSTTNKSRRGMRMSVSGDQTHTSWTSFVATETRTWFGISVSASSKKMLPFKAVVFNLGFVDNE